MHPTVTAAWPAFCTGFEGRCSWMYLDVKRKVTAGVGNLLPSLDAARGLPWLTASGQTASSAEVEREWDAVRARAELAPRGGFAYQHLAALHLDDAAIDRLLLDRTEEFWARLLRSVPDAETWPADAQLATLDLAWQNGPAFLESRDAGGSWVWPGTRAALLAQDWAAAATHVPGDGRRADRRRRLFTNAAAVARLDLDHARLWDTTTPTGAGTDQPPAPAEGTTMSDVHHDHAYGDWVLFRGGRIPPVDRDILLAIPSYVRGLTQGGLSSAVKASAHTHVGLGAFDISIGGMSKAEVWTMASELLRSGIVPFPRGFVSDSFQGRTVGNIHDGNEHIHCCSVESYAHLHPQAKAQVDEYRRGGDGLRGSAGYTGPRTPLGRWADSPYNPANVRREGGTSVVGVDTLLGLDVDRATRTSRERGATVAYVRRVRRWGRWNAVTDDGTYYAIADDRQQYLVATG